MYVLFVLFYTHVTKQLELLEFLLICLMLIPAHFLVSVPKKIFYYIFHLYFSNT